MDWNPLRSVLNQALRSTLEKYVSNIDFDSLGVGGGAIVLRDLELRRESFPSHRGLSLARGFVKELRLSIPWTQLLSSAVVIEIRTCEVVFVQEDEYESHSSPPKAAGAGAETGLDTKGWMSDMIKTIAANASVEITNLVVKVERKHTLVAAVSLKSLLLCTCDASTWEKRFQRPTEPFGELFKLLEIGGLTINVERKRPALPSSPSLLPPASSFEFPVLNRTDARVRICLHLSPQPVAAVATAATTVTGTGKSSLSNMLKRVTSAVSVPSPSSSPAAAAAAVPESPSPEAVAAVVRKLDSTADPFLGAVADPLHHRAQFVAGVDVWIERLSFSVSEKQLEILIELCKPPVALDRSPPVVAVVAAAAVPVEEPSGWTSWAWQTVAPIHPTNGGGGGEKSSTAAHTEEPQAQTISVYGLRVDRCTLSLMLHSKSRDPADVRGAQEVTPKKVIRVAVQTPTGVVFVEGDEDEDEDVRKRKQAQQQQQRRRLVTFAEICLRTVTVQTSKVTGEPVRALLDVESVEATRWHEDYTERDMDSGLVLPRHDSFLSWFGSEEGGLRSRAGLPHPHCAWTFWAHPNSLQAVPAVRVGVTLDLQEVLMDVALSPLTLTVDSLLYRGASRFVPWELVQEFASSSPKPPTPPTPRKAVEVLVTCASAQLAVSNLQDSVRFDLANFYVAGRGAKDGDAGVDFLDCTVRSPTSSKRVLHLGGLHVLRGTDLALERASIGLSPAQASVVLAIATSFVPLPLEIRLESTTSDHTAVQVAVGGAYAKRSLHGGDVDLGLDELVVSVIAGQTQHVFCSKPQTEFARLNAVQGATDVTLRLGKWEAEWSGLVKCAVWASYFTLPASSSNSSSTERLPPKAFPRLTVDLESGVVAAGEGTEIRFPTVTVRTPIADRHYEWEMEGWRVVVDQHVVLANAKLMGTLSFSNQVSVRVLPVLLDVSQDCLERVRVESDALWMALRGGKNRHRPAGKPPAVLLLDVRLVLDDVNVVLRVGAGTDDRSVGVDPISDVPNFLGLRIANAHAAVRLTPHEQQVDVQVQDVTVCEEDWVMVAFRKQEDGGHRGASVRWRSLGEEDVLTVQLASLDCNLRGGALRVPVAMFSRFATARSARARTLPVKRQLALELAIAPCTLTVPVTSTLNAGGAVQVVYVCLGGNGLHWSRNRLLGAVALELGWGELVDGNLTPSAVWGKIEPVVQVQLPENHLHIHCPLLAVCLASARDIVRLQTCALVLASRSALEEPGHGDFQLPQELKPSPSRSAWSCSVGEISLQVVERDLVSVRVTGLSFSPSPLQLGFSSASVQSLSHSVLTSHEFSLTSRVCELSRGGGGIRLVLEPLVLDALFAALVLPIATLDTSLVALRRPANPQPQRQRHGDATTTSFKILLPPLRVSLHSRFGFGPVVVLQLVGGIGSMASSSTVDLTLAGLELQLFPNGEEPAAARKLQLMPKTDVRLFGELLSRQFALELVDVKVHLGLENVAILLAVVQSFQALLVERVGAFARGWERPPSSAVVASGGEPAKEETLEQVCLTNGQFEMLLDKDVGEGMDPGPGQLVFANGKQEPGFKFRFPHGERRVSKLHTTTGQLLLEPSLGDFSGLEFACEFLLWDALRERWVSLVKFALQSTCRQPPQAQPDEEDLTAAFASWMEQEVGERLVDRADNSCAQTFKTLGEAAELYWMRWEPLGDMSDMQRVAVSNALAHSLTLSSWRVRPPVVDIKIHTSNVAVHVLHHCLDSHGPLMAASELFVVRAPQSKLRVVYKSHRDWLVLMEHVLRLEVNRVADFTRNIVLRDCALTCELSPSLLDVQLGSVHVDLQPESLQVFSHAVRGLAVDFAPKQLAQRVREYAEERPLCDVIVAKTSCSCARVSFINSSGRPVWFKREEEDAVLLREEDGSVAFSWTCCLCPGGGKPLPTSRLVRFAFNVPGKEEDEDGWSQAVDLETTGMFHLAVALPGGASDLWVSVQLGEPTIQTIVTLHASDLAVNHCQAELEMLPINGQSQHSADVILLEPGKPVRFMLCPQKRGGWMFRARGSEQWSKLVPTTGNSGKAVLVEVPTCELARPLFAWAKFSRERGEGGGEAWWNVVELWPSFTFANHTQFTLQVKVRPEHRWESLQYALQSVTLTTTPPGPVGTWLALAPASPRQAVAEERAPLAFEAAPPPQGQVLARELLGSVSSPRKQPPPGTLHHFSSSLDLSSALAEGFLTEFIVPSGGSVALAIDPRDSHALLVACVCDDRLVEGEEALLLPPPPPLRLHPNMLHSVSSWQRCVEIGESGGLAAIALAQGSNNGTPRQSVSISLSPLFQLRNDTDRDVYWMPISLADNGQQLSAAATVLVPGQQVAIHTHGCDALRLAAGQMEDWSDAFGLTQGHVNVSIPLGQDFYLQTSVTTTLTDRVCRIAPRVKLCNLLDVDVKWTVPSAAAECVLAALGGTASIPSQVSEHDGGLCAVVRLFAESGEASHCLFLDPLAALESEAVFLLGKRLLTCRRTTAPDGDAVFVLSEDGAQARFLLANLSPIHVVEMVSCTAKVGGQCGSKVVLQPGAKVPFDWRCFDNLSQWRDQCVVQNLKPNSVVQDRFFAQEANEKMRLRMVSEGEQPVPDYSLGFWRPQEEKGWSPTVSTASGTVYTFYLGNILVSSPLETGAKLLSISSLNQAEAEEEVAATNEEHRRVVLVRVDALLAKFSTRSTEVLLLGVTGVSASLQLSHTRCEVDVGVKQIQLESLLPLSEFPIVACLGGGNGEEGNCLHVHSLFTCQRPWFFKDIRAELGPVVLNVEDYTIKQWIVVFAPLLASMAADWKLLGGGRTSGQSFKPRPPLFVCETLELGAVQCLLTLKTSQGVFVGIDRTPLSLWPVSASNVRCSGAHLGSELSANYLADLLLNSPALLGSLEIIGNPTGFIRSLALGVHALVATPFRELKRGWGPRGLLRGVALGWLGLLSHVADGALTSVSGFSASLARNLHLSIARKQTSSPLTPDDSSRLQSVLRGMVGVVVRPAGNAAELVSQATKRITTRLRPAVVRLRPMDPQTHLQVDVERMLAWNLFGGENVVVLRTDVCEFDVDEDGARSSCQVRVLLTSKGVCALRGSCLLHNAREWLFVHPWADVVSVQESLSKLTLAVLLVKDDGEASQQKLLRFTFQSEAQRRAFVLDALASM